MKKTNMVRGAMVNVARCIMAMAIALIALSGANISWDKGFQVNLSPDRALAAGNNYYVATTGNNSDPGTLAEPWATLTYADTQVSPGDTVYVRGGTYNEWFIITTSGTAGNIISYKNYPTETPVMDGTGLEDPGQQGIVTIQASYILFEGFEVKNNPYYYGIWSWGSSPWTNIIIKDCYIHHNFWGGIQISAWHKEPNPITNVTIDGCECAYNHQSGISEYYEIISLVYVIGFEIKNCHLHDDIWQEGIDAKCGCANGTIHDNEVEDSELGIYIDGYDRSESNIDIYNNKLHNNGSGMTLACETGGDLSMLDINFYNNLLYLNSSSGFSVYDDAYTRTWTLINNTFYLNEDLQSDIAGDETQNIDCIVRNNIFVGETDDSALFTYPEYESGGVTVDHNLFFSQNGLYNAFNVYGTDYIYDEDPLLINPVSDFSIPYNSPAKDSGSPTSAPSTDYIGTARPQGAGYDIGAYEYFGSPVVVTNAATSVESTTATLPGNVTDTGGENCTVTMYWGDNNGGEVPDNWDNSSAPTSPSQPQGVAAFYKNVTSLPTGTTLYFTASANNTAGTDWATTLSFLTKPSAPTNVVATNGSSTANVTITWTQSSGNVTGYYVIRDSTNLGDVGDVATHDDTGADAPTITAGTATATDGSQTAHVALAVSGASTSNGTTHTYKVIAYNATGNSTDSSTDTGYRGVGSLTYQWKVSAGDSDASFSSISGGTTASYNYTSAPAGTITAGTADASDNTSASHVTLTLAGESTSEGAGRYYYCTLSASGASDQDTTHNRGYRGVGSLTYQWQRSSGDSDEDYSNISGATSDPYNDTGAPENGDGRYYKCILNATGASQQISTADRGYLGLEDPVVWSRIDTFIGLRVILSTFPTLVFLVALIYFGGGIFKNTYKTRGQYLVTADALVDMSMAVLSIVAFLYLLYVLVDLTAALMV